VAPLGPRLGAAGFALDRPPACHRGRAGILQADETRPRCASLIHQHGGRARANSPLPWASPPRYRGTRRSGAAAGRVSRRWQPPLPDRARGAIVAPPCPTAPTARTTAARAPCRLAPDAAATEPFSAQRIIAMTIKVGINGFGRIGRLVLRAAWHWPDVEFVRINDPGGDAATFAHLLVFDSVHGRWDKEVNAEGELLFVEGQRIATSRNRALADTDWSGCDVVVECSGKMKTLAVLQTYLDQGVQRVVVSAPVKDPTVLNVVIGVNHQRYQPDQHRIVSAASCTTNCLAPVVKVIHEGIGIRHGSITTIHSLTNTQTILDAPQKDLRRARACGMSLIPTSTGAASAIAGIFPELKGRLNGLAVRVPLANASLTDCVFEVERATTVEEVNELLRTAADGALKDILGYEERPLVSIDYRTDPRSSVVDARSTLVVNGTQVKIYAWYDNEWAYANRTAELMRMVGLADRAAV
jgi:glyceraldehyde 3-phosphate dehydrogenase